VATRSEDSLHPDQGASERDSNDSRSKGGHSVQTFLDVGIVLQKRRDWTWEASDPENLRTSKWRLVIHPSVLHWLTSRKIIFKKQLIKLPRTAGSKHLVSHLVMRFTNHKDARYFLSAWGLETMHRDVLAPYLESSKSRYSKWQ